MFFSLYFGASISFVSSMFVVLLFIFPQVSFLFSDRGTPDGYRHMNGYGSHTFKNVNAQGHAVRGRGLANKRRAAEERTKTEDFFFFCGGRGRGFVGARGCYFGC